MDISLFLEDKRTLDILDKIQTHCKSKHFSDVLDDDGNQYVDLVMEGGGMLGIALVGYTYALECAGIRFLGLGGTSAGSINALLIAALGKPNQPKGDKLLNLLANQNFYDFVDGDSDSKELIESWINGVGNFKLAFKAIQTIDNLKNDLGLNPGIAFYEWLQKVLLSNQIKNYSDLKNRMHDAPKLKLRSGEIWEKRVDEIFRLAIITADVTTETKVELPRMAELYWKEVNKISPALFARASMSIPFFFHPMKVTGIPKDINAEARWEKLAGYLIKEEGKLPDQVLFMDGGIMSNFPIDVFHNPSAIPKAPTFGVKLELDRRLKKIDGPLDLLGAIFNASRHTLDYDFIHRNPDYSRLVTWIPAEGFNWLDFEMSEKHKIDLFIEGVSCAADFLCRFDWQAYKKIREGTVTQSINASTN